jgi:tetratricopeptide (TPR) repeat protein
MRTSATARGLVLSTLLIFTACEKPPPQPSAAEIEQLLKQVANLRQRQQEAQALEATESFFDRHAFVELVLVPSVFELRKEHALLLMTFTRLEAAVDILRELSAAAPTDASLSLLIGRSQARLGNHDEALHAYQRVPDSTRRAELLDYGNALLNGGNERDGLTALAACLIRNPWRDAAYLALGRALVRAGRPQNAKVFLERYRAAEPHRRAEAEALRFERGGMWGLSLWTRGKGELARGNVFGARRRHREAIGVDSGTAESYLELGRVSLALDRPHQAIDFLRQLPPEAPFVALQGEAFEILGDEATAARLYQQALDRDGTLDEPRQGLQRISEGRGLSRTDDPADITVLREDIRNRTSKLDLEQSIPDFIDLAGALHKSSVPALVMEAERIVLFLQQFAPTNESVRKAVLKVARRPELVFFRLQVLVQDPLLCEELDRELQSLSLDRKTLGRALEGYRLGRAR